MSQPVCLVYLDVIDRDTGVKASKESAKQFVLSPNTERPRWLIGRFAVTGPGSAQMTPSFLTGGSAQYVHRRKNMT
jgi:hypothetical protein